MNLSLFQFFFRAILCLFFVSSLSTLLAQTPRAEFDRYKNPIVFCRTHFDESSGEIIRNSKLWVMEEDGSRLKQLTFGLQYDDHPSFYADQRRVLYSEFESDSLDRGSKAKLISLDIYTGERKIVLEEDGKALHHATISPLGDDLIVYNKDSKERRAEWFGLPPNDYEINLLASNGVAVAKNSIVFMHEKNAGLNYREVSLVHISGKGLGASIRILTDDKHLHRRPAISPDGLLLAWQSNAESESDEIRLADINGNTAKDITNSPGNDGHPWFSRDGKWLVFESDRTADWVEGNGCDSRTGCEIWKINVETGEEILLTSGGRKFASNRPRM
jgi:Tol biopolymer transport system component